MADFAEFQEDIASFIILSKMFHAGPGTKEFITQINKFITLNKHKYKTLRPHNNHIDYLIEKIKGNNH